MLQIKNQKKVRIDTLGCRVNQYESAAVARELESAGFLVAKDGELCDIYIINTCAVTGESERKSRQFIRRAASQNPQAGVIVMGCYSQLKAEEAAALPRVIGVLGNRNKLQAVAIAESFANGALKAPVIAIENVQKSPLEPMHITHTENARAFVKIEDGCDNACTYCIIKTARGDVVSRLPQDVCAEVRDLVRAGYKEIVLTGIETASYGKDLQGEDLGTLAETVGSVPGVERLRFGSLEPSHITPAFLAHMEKCPVFMPSFHLSLQSGSSTVLSRMRRRYNAGQAMACIRAIRERIPHATLTCDIIVGFPGESEAEFEETCAFAREAKFLHMHIFPFSPRKGTEAASMDCQIPEPVKAARAAHLAAIGREITGRLYEEHIGKTGSVLFETYENGLNKGHSEDMLEVVLPGESRQGEILCVRYRRIEKEKLIGEILPRGSD